MLVEDEGEKHPYLITRWSTDDVKPSFLEPFPDDAWYFKFPGIEQARIVADAQKRDAKVGIYWMYGTYKTEQAESKDAA